jgi:hypothetical protein
LPRRPLTSWEYHLGATERAHRFLAEHAFGAGFPELSPILIPAATSLGIEGVRRVLLVLATGIDRGRGAEGAEAVPLSPDS